MPSSAIRASFCPAEPPRFFLGTPEFGRSFNHGENGRQFRDFSEVEKAEREFYRELTGRPRLDILLELSKQVPERPIIHSLMQAMPA